MKMQLLGIRRHACASFLTILTIHSAAASTLVKVSSTSMGKSSQYIGTNDGDSSTAVNAQMIQDAGLNSIRIFHNMAVGDRAATLVDVGAAKRAIARFDSQGGVASADCSEATVKNALKMDFAKMSYGALDTKLRDSFSKKISPMIILRSSQNMVFSKDAKGNKIASTKNPQGVLPQNVTFYGGCVPTATSLKGMTWKDSDWTDKDWSDLWRYAFGFAYYVNSKNKSSMQVDMWSIFNEANHNIYRDDGFPRSQGFCGTTAQYQQYSAYVQDAIDFYYAACAGKRTHTLSSVAASKIGNTKEWLSAGTHDGANGTGADLAYVGGPVRSYYHPGSSLVPDAHPYAESFSGTGDMDRSYSRRDYASAVGINASKFMISEWGTWKEDAGPIYDDARIGVQLILANLVRDQMPESSVYGSFFWRLRATNSETLTLIRKDGSKRMGYYALKMGARALAGGLPAYKVNFSSGNITGVTTVATSASGSKKVNTLVVNVGTGAMDYVIQIPAALASGTTKKATIRTFNKASNGETAVAVTSTLNSDGSLNVPLKVVAGQAGAWIELQ